MGYLHNFAGYSGRLFDILNRIKIDYNRFINTSHYTNSFNYLLIKKLFYNEKCICIFNSI